MGSNNTRRTTEASTLRQSRFHIEDAPHDKELDNRSNYIGFTDTQTYKLPNYAPLE